jgi:hypothetical protein
MGLASMDTTDATRRIIENRKRRQKERAAEVKALGKFRKRQRHRMQEGRTWPIDAATGEKADVDHEDVLAPLPDDMKAPIGDVDEKMQKLRAEADQHQSFEGATVPIDEGVLSRRRRERHEELASRSRIQGDRWTEDMVEARMEEAFRTLFRSSNGGVRPKAFGNGMPEVIREVSDLVHQAGNKSLRNAIAHRFKGAPTTDEVRRADDALTWATRYLLDEHPDLAAFANLGAMWKAWGAKISRKCADIGVHRQAFYRDRREAIRLIVEGLKRDGKAPT